MQGRARQGALGWRREGAGPGPTTGTHMLVAGTSGQASCLLEGFLGVGAADYLCLHLCWSPFKSPCIGHLSESVLVAPSARPRI